MSEPKLPEKKIIYPNDTTLLRTTKQAINETIVKCSIVIDRHKQAIKELREAAFEALSYIENDEVSHGREFKAGIALRQALLSTERMGE